MVDVDGHTAGGEGPEITVEQVSEASGVVTFRVAGQLDVSTEGVLRERLDRAIEAGASTVVLDLSELAFMDSSGIAVMLVAARRTTAFELRNPTDIVRRLIEITGLSDTLRMTSDA